MTRPIRRTPQAGADIRAAAKWYFEEAGPITGARFAEALDMALDFIAENPRAASPRYALELAMDGLRVWPVKGFPYLLFFTETPSGLRLLRVLHAHRDIPDTMMER